MKVLKKLLIGLGLLLFVLIIGSQFLPSPTTPNAAA